MIRCDPRPSLALLLRVTEGRNRTDELFAEEGLPVEGSERGRASLHVPVNDKSDAAHLGRPSRYHVQHLAIERAEGVELRAEFCSDRGERCWPSGNGTDLPS